MLNCINFHPILNPEDNDLFGYKLDFETTNYFDGNIGKQTWRSKNSSSTSMKSYIYGYDNSDRLLSATYSGAAYFSVPFINYDLNGNIKNLHRNGSTDSSNSAMDRLQYAYSGNKLLSVTDTITWNPDMGDFRDGNTSGNDYTYWSDGSLKSDANKGISQIDYDSYLKKVKQVSFGNGNWIKWYYNGQGDVLKRDNSGGTKWVYSENAIYKNDSLYQIGIQEGRVILDTNQNFNYEFEYRDHLGNLRLSIRDTTIGNPEIHGVPNITQEVDYYPFGLEHKTTSQTFSKPQNFKFQNQERVEDFNLNWDFFKYRYSDPQLGRFFQSDPISEDYLSLSNYQFASNSPIMKVELEGLEGIPYYLIPNAVQNPNGVSAHTLGFASGVKNALSGIQSMIQSPRQTVKSFLELASPLPNATQFQAAQGIINDVDALVNGDGMERGEMIGRNATNIAITKGVTEAIGSVSNTLTKVDYTVATATEFADPKFAKQLLRSLEESGEKSVQSSIKSLTKKITKHESDLAKYRKEGGYTSSVERELRTFNKQLDTAKEFVKRNNIDIE